MPPSGPLSSSFPTYSSLLFFQVLHTYVTCMDMCIHTCKLEYKFHAWENHAALVFLILVYSLSLMLSSYIHFPGLHSLRLYWYHSSWPCSWLYFVTLLQMNMGIQVSVWLLRAFIVYYIVVFLKIILVYLFIYWGEGPGPRCELGQPVGFCFLP